MLYAQMNQADEPAPTPFCAAPHGSTPGKRAGMCCDVRWAHALQEWERSLQHASQPQQQSIVPSSGAPGPDGRRTSHAQDNAKQAKILDMGLAMEMADL